MAFGSRLNLASGRVGQRDDHGPVSPFETSSSGHKSPSHCAKLRQTRDNEAFHGLKSRFAQPWGPAAVGRGCKQERSRGPPITVNRTGSAQPADRRLCLIKSSQSAFASESIAAASKKYLIVRTDASNHYESERARSMHTCQTLRTERETT